MRHGSEVEKTIREINYDFKEKNFVGAIKSIEIRRSDSGDKMVQLLLRIKGFSDENQFHLAGINIYLTEFYQFIGERASYFIPFDADERLSAGSRTRYDTQLSRFGNMIITDPRVQYLVDLIHKHHRGYDQEGYLCNLREWLA